MIQKFLEGKKKYSAFIISIGAALIPLFITEPEAQREIMDLVPSLAAVLAGLIYMVTEGGLDKEREKAKAAAAQAAIANGSAATITQAGAPASAAQVQPAPAAPLPVIEAPPEPFDIKSFHEAVLAEVEAAYKEVNPATIYYKARDKGQVTACQHITQAVDYWDYLVELATEARDWLKEQVEQKEGTCQRTPEWYVFTRDYSSTLRAHDRLLELANAGLDWKSQLAPFQRKLYTVGVLAEDILSVYPVQ